jgi:hypothetical protein
MILLNNNNNNNNNNNLFLMFNKTLKIRRDLIKLEVTLKEYQHDNQVQIEKISL